MSVTEWKASASAMSRFMLIPPLAHCAQRFRTCKARIELPMRQRSRGEQYGELVRIRWWRSQRVGVLRQESGVRIAICKTRMREHALEIRGVGDGAERHS